MFQEYENATKEENCNPEVWVNLACTYFFLGMYKQAEAAGFKGKWALLISGILTNSKSHFEDFKTYLIPFSIEEKSSDIRKLKKKKNFTLERILDLSNFTFKKRVNLCATYPPQFTSSEAKAKKQKDERRKRARCLS